MGWNVLGQIRFVIGWRCFPFPHQLHPQKGGKPELSLLREGSRKGVRDHVLVNPGTRSIRARGIVKERLKGLPEELAQENGLEFLRRLMQVLDPAIRCGGSLKGGHPGL